MGQPRIEIYTKLGCWYCVKAKHLLEDKQVRFDEIDVTMGGAKREEMLARAPGSRTVPQIFIGGAHVGGYDDLAKLEREGRLDPLLQDMGG
jgi:glutaredoxin 3